MSDDGADALIGLLPSVSQKKEGKLDSSGKQAENGTSHTSRSLVWLGSCRGQPKGTRFYLPVGEAGDPGLSPWSVSRGMDHHGIH